MLGLAKVGRRAARVAACAVPLTVAMIASGTRASAHATAPPQSTPPPTRPAGGALLSNERTFTRWAHPASTDRVFTRPSTASGPITRLHPYTEDGFPEVYLLLRAARDPQGRKWIKLRIPGRPNGQTGWVQRPALGPFHLTHQLVVVNRERLRISFYSDGRQIWSAPVGVGKPSTPTPAGHFWIRERFAIHQPSSGYYPYAFGTADYSTLTEWPKGGVVGIHGPYYDAQEIPGQISHGCIRLRVRDDLWLGHHLDIGAPLQVM
jgi:hypothetical protein